MTQVITDLIQILKEKFSVTQFACLERKKTFWTYYLLKAARLYLTWLCVSINIKQALTERSCLKPYQRNKLRLGWWLKLFDPISISNTLRVFLLDFMWEAAITKIYHVFNNRILPPTTFFTAMRNWFSFKHSCYPNVTIIDFDCFTPIYLTCQCQLARLKLFLIAANFFQLLCCVCVLGEVKNH